MLTSILRSICYKQGVSYSFPMKYHWIREKQKGDTNTMVSQVEVALDTIDIYFISDILDVISSDSLKDNRFRFSDQQILRIMVQKSRGCL